MLLAATRNSKARVSKSAARVEYGMVVPARVFSMASVYREEVKAGNHTFLAGRKCLDHDDYGSIRVSNKLEAT